MLLIIITIVVVPSAIWLATWLLEAKELDYSNERGWERKYEYEIERSKSELGNDLF